MKALIASIAALMAITSLSGCASIEPEPCSAEWIEWKSERVLHKFARQNRGLVRDLRKFSKTRTLVLASLADACVAHEFTSNAPTILTQKSEANGKTYSSLCINKNGMNDEEVANWIEQNGDLSDAQREAFLQQQGSKRITSWHYKSELDGAAK